MSHDYQDPDLRCDDCGTRLSDEDVEATRELCPSCRCSNCGFRPGYCDCVELPCCPVCGLPVLPDDAPVDGCHPTCPPGDDA